jgi:hypothetical protein
VTPNGSAKLLSAERSAQDNNRLLVGSQAPSISKNDVA